MPTPAQMRIRTNSSTRLARHPFTAELDRDISHLERTAERLERLRKPTELVLLCLRTCAAHLGVRSAHFKVHLQSRLNASSTAIEHLQERELQTLQPSSADDEQRARAGVARKVAAEVATELAVAFSEGDPQGIAFATRTIETLGALEDSVARERLASLGIGGDVQNLSLEDLLRQQAVLSDLELRPAEELRNYYEALLRVSPDEARRIEGPILLVAKKRGDPVPARHRAREAARPNDVETDRLAALSLVREIQRQRELRTSPELDVFENEVRPQLAAIVRRTLGINVRELDAAEFERFSRSWRASTRLDEIPVRNAWPLRAGLAELPDSVRRQLPGKLFAPVALASKEG